MSNPLFTPNNLRAALLGVVNHIMDHYDAGLFSEGDALGRVLASVCVLQDEVYYREERAREEENIRFKKAFAEWSLASEEERKSVTVWAARLRDDFDRA